MATKTSMAHASCSHFSWVLLAGLVDVGFNCIDNSTSTPMDTRGVS
jgi:hypothetical protein